MSKDNGGPAFPVVFDDSVGADFSVEKGMTVRDYTAIKAMQGIVAGAMADGSEWDGKAAGFISKAAYQLADAMLKEREK